jgi:purine-cytosine permease-like protein
LATARTPQLGQPTKSSGVSPIFFWTLGGLCASYIWTYAIGLAGARVLSNQTAAGVRSLVGRGAWADCTDHRYFRGDHLGEIEKPHIGVLDTA